MDWEKETKGHPIMEPATKEFMKRIMDKTEIFAEQDRAVDWLEDAMRLQKKSGYRICAWFPGRDLPAPCDSTLRSMLNMTTREDLQNKIKKALEIIA